MLLPYSEPMPGFYVLKPVSHGVLPEHRTNCFVIGGTDGDALIVDPSPVDEDQYSRLKADLAELTGSAGFVYMGVFITHHHVDHCNQADRLARELGLPIFISRDSLLRLLQKFQMPGIEKLDVRHPLEGDVILQREHEEVQVYDIPGHDEGHLGLGGANWFLAGDLIQEKGTVVIGGDEGDMIKYFRSLERIIEMAPKFVFPSHGSVLRGTAQLKKTLKHRKEREKQVLKLHSQGLSPQAMVESIYKNVDVRLWPLGLENIKSHLKKLERELKL